MVLSMVSKTRKGWPLCTLPSLVSFHFPIYLLHSFKKETFIYLFIREGKRRERNIDVWEIHQSACNPGMCPDWELNRQLFGSQGSTQSTEPHQPGLFIMLFGFPSIPFLTSGPSDLFFTLCCNIILYLVLSHHLAIILKNQLSSKSLPAPL